MATALRRGVAAFAALIMGVTGALVAGVAAEAANPVLTQKWVATSSLSPVQDSGATADVWSSPAVGDVTGDGTPEIVVGGLNSIARVYGLTGSLLTQIDPERGPAPPSNVGATQASPALADMNGDGVLDIVLANTGGVLAAYSYKNASLSQISSVYVPPAFNGALRGIFSTPAIGYIDGDTRPDVVTTTWGQEMDAWSGPSLTKINPIHKWLLDTIWSSPAIGDVDGDGEVEIVFGADCDGSSTHPQLDSRCRAGWQGDQIGGGFVVAVNLDGSIAWNHFVDNAVIWSSPALADLNGDGRLDVVVGTGLYFQTNQARKVIALNGTNGNVMWEAPTSGIPVGSPAVGEVDGGGRPEVFIVTRGGCLQSYDGENGNLRSGFPASVLDSGSCGGGSAATNGGVSLADIDGDGVVEALTMGEQQVKIFSAATGALETTVRAGYSGTLFASPSTPTVANVNGKAWVITTQKGSANGGELVVTAWESASALGAAPWPTFKQNMQRTSNAIAQTPPDNSANENFVRQMYRDFLGREASTGDVSHWAGLLASRQIDRYGFATTLSRTDEWITSVITEFYLDTLGRAPDSAGLRGWIDAARAGMPVAQIASAFYASPEYFATTGQNDYKIWVEDLYRKLLLREPETGGVNGWVGALRGGMPRDTLTFGFYQSGETLGVRITALYQSLLGRAPENGAIPNWAPFVSNQGDLVLAAALAASNEYFSYAQTPH